MSRRMFSDEITTTDAFLDLPKGSQLLYFHLGMSADDDGFVANPKMTMRVIGSSEDELKVLFAKKFLLPFTNGVCVVKHWRINNFVRKDIYKETKYLRERGQLFIRKNGTYTFNPENAQKLPSGHFTVDSLSKNRLMESGYFDVVNDTLTQRQHRKGKVRIGKVSIGKDSAVEKDSSFDEFWSLYPKKELKKKTQEIWNRKRLSKHSKEIIEFVSKAKGSDRWRKGFVKNPPAFLNGECWNDDLSTYGDFNGKDTGTLIIEI